jgi:hypothetical protein
MTPPADDNITRRIGIDIACALGAFLVIGITLGLVFGAWECLAAVAVIIMGISIFAVLKKILNLIMKGKP